MSLLCAKVNKCIWGHSLSVAVSSMGREQAVIIEMIGPLLTPNGLKTNLKNVCVCTHCGVIMRMRRGGSSARCLSSLTIWVSNCGGFQKWFITKQPCCSLCKTEIAFFHLAVSMWIEFICSTPAQSLSHSVTPPHIQPCLTQLLLLFLWGPSTKYNDSRSCY